MPSFVDAGKTSGEATPVKMHIHASMPFRKNAWR
jgi:hypothetical protein